MFSSLRPNHRRLIYLWSALLPLLTLICGLLFTSQMGPFSMAKNLDPDYAYLLNSLNIVHGERPYHIDHPGTPVQLFGTIVLLSTHLLYCPSTCPSIDESVLSNPELYLKSFNFGLQFLVTIGLCILGFVVFKNYKSKSLMFVSQLSLFLTPIPFQYLRKVSPEPMLIFIGLSISTVLIAMINNPPNSRQRDALLLGSLVGLGLATKINFIPLLCLGLIWWSFRYLILFSISSAAFFLFGTIPIWPQLKNFFLWVVGLSTHAGQYASGPVGLPDSSTIVTNWKGLLTELPWFFIFVSVMIVFIIMGLTKKSFRQKHAFQLRLGVLIFFAIVINVVLVVKHPGIRYLIPSFVLVSTVPGLCYSLLADHKRALQILMSVLGAYFAFTSCQSWKSTQNLISEMEVSIQERNEIENLLSSRMECQVVEYYPASSPRFALLFGNSFSGERFSTALKKEYPNYLTFQLGLKRFASWDGIVDESEEKIILNSGCLFFTGAKIENSDYKEFFSRFQLKEIYSGRSSGVYQLLRRN